MPKALVVDHVTKEYKLGALAHETMLREALVNLVRYPFRRRPRREEETINALKDVSFTVETGGVVGIIGRNGAGKSTLLKILSRITYPTSGTIQLEGRVASLLEVGTGFHEELTGRENVYLNGSVLGMKKREIDVLLDEIIDFAGIHRFIDTPIKRYSSGMRLRLGFAVAAHLQTDILLVDEVLAVGDFEFQKKCLSKIENLHRGGRTVLFVSHNTAAVEHLCPRTLWIDQGQVRQDGATADVIRDYLAHFSASLRTDPNLVDLQEREGTGEVRFTGIEFLDVAGQPMHIIRSGDELTIRLHYNATRNLENARFGIDLHTDWGTHVASICTPVSGWQIPYLSAGEGYVEVALEGLNLTPGRYWISLWTTGPNHFSSAKNGWDVLPRCKALDIEPSDFFNSGKGVDRGYGFVLLPCKWNLHDACEPADAVPDAQGTGKRARQ